MKKIVLLSSFILGLTSILTDCGAHRYAPLKEPPTTRQVKGKTYINTSETSTGMRGERTTITLKFNENGTAELTRGDQVELYTYELDKTTSTLNFYSISNHTFRFSLTITDDKTLTNGTIIWKN